ncbi:MAG: acyl-CoA dehydrogenase family protein [Bacteroidota bacterium]
MNKPYTQNIIPGAAWLIHESSPESFYFPENQDADNATLEKKCIDFLRENVLPFIEKIDKSGRTLMPAILKKAGQENLLAITTPVKWGGLGKKFIDAGIATEILGAGNSFSVAYAAHTGIGLLPVLYFGNEYQQQKYLTELASGKCLGAYALTEPGSGSDAMAASTKATLSEDKNFYILNGQKCWITNGGFADIFTVFAKIEDDVDKNGRARLSAFIVEKNFPGFTQGPDEKKMGIKGSSTTTLFFNDCKVPVSNLLGEAGKGHIIAFNILNIGRLKLAQFNLGAIKKSYNKMIAQLPLLNTTAANLLQVQITKTSVKIFACEAAIYRTASLIQTMQSAADKEDQQILLKAADEYSIECAMMKIYASELLDVTVDVVFNMYAANALNGATDAFRDLLDARINRIYEGTNEVNRIFMIETLAKRFISGRLVLTNENNNSTIDNPDHVLENELSPEMELIKKSKKIFIEIFQLALKTYNNVLSKQQELIIPLSNIFKLIYHAESAALRTMAIKDKPGDVSYEQYSEMTRYFLYESIDSIYKYSKDCLEGFLEGDQLTAQMKKLDTLVSKTDFNLNASAKKIYSMMQNYFRQPVLAS